MLRESFEKLQVEIAKLALPSVSVLLGLDLTDHLVDGYLTLSCFTSIA